MNDEADVYIGPKEIGAYISSCFFALGRSDKIKIVSRGKNNSKALNVLAILVREYLENADYDISIDSEKFEERFITTLKINLSGVKKEKK